MKGDAGDPILTVSKLRAGYGDEDVLQGVDLAVERGSIVTVIGPNGSGKSTLLKTIYGLVKSRAGELSFYVDGGRPKDLRRLRPHEITRLGINYVPQIWNTFPEMTIRENLEIGGYVDRAAFEPRLTKALEAFPALGTKLSARANTLSGGQRQMLGIARAMMSDPQLLILDEPSAGLGPAIVDEVFDRISAINRLGVSILIVEQKARQCLALADFGYVLDLGKNRLQGSGADLLHDREVIRLYLGGGSSSDGDVSSFRRTRARPVTTVPEQRPPDD
jgi:ABC-type branched-subunit amino acid transport system ATPase component